MGFLRVVHLPEAMVVMRRRSNQKARAPNGAIRIDGRIVQTVRGSLQLHFGFDEARAPTPLSRATATRSRFREAPTPKPWLAVVLAIDTARRSGWALGQCGKLVRAGEVDTLDEAIVDQIVANAVELAASVSLPCVLVLESAFGGSVDVVSALGVARERWLRAWRGADQALGRVVKVQPSSWRAPVLGSSSIGLPREQVRELEQRSATVIAGYPVGPDEAAAILIARWGAHAALVGKAIGKRASKASLRAWTGRV